MEARGHTVSCCLSPECSHAQTGGAWVVNDMPELQRECRICLTSFKHALFQRQAIEGQKLIPCFQSRGQNDQASKTKGSGGKGVQTRMLPWEQTPDLDNNESNFLNSNSKGSVKGGGKRNQTTFMYFFSLSSYQNCIDSIYTIK